MNDRSAKPKQAMTATQKGRPQSGEYPRTSSVDDEFHEFFKQGDIGEYEGGVAHTQPPSRLLPEVDEQIVMTDSARQRARRAFFGRVVAIIVAACVLLLVTAARFKPQDIRKVGQNDTRHASGQFAETEEVKLSPPPRERIQALPIVPAVAAVTSAVPQAAVVAAPPPPEEKQPQAPAQSEKPLATKTGAQGTKSVVDLPTAETARPQAKQKPSATTTSAKVSSGSGAPVQPANKSKATATRETPPPAPGVSKPVKESVGAFPVD